MNTSKKVNTAKKVKTAETAVIDYAKMDNKQLCGQLVTNPIETAAYIGTLELSQIMQIAEILEIAENAKLLEIVDKITAAKIKTLPTSTVKNAKKFDKYDLKLLSDMSRNCKFVLATSDSIGKTNNVFAFENGLHAVGKYNVYTAKLGTWRTEKPKTANHKKHFILIEKNGELLTDVVENLKKDFGFIMPE